MVRALILAALAFAANALAFDLQGHRGTRGLAPENTLAAFERALAIGVTTLETDMAVTKDGMLVISHDPFLNPDIVRGPDGAWLEGKGPPIHSLTYDELQKFDIGRTKVKGGAWDYIKENKDYPYYLIRDRFAGAQGTSLRVLGRGKGKILSQAA